MFAQLFKQLAKLPLNYKNKQLNYLQTYVEELLKYHSIIEQMNQTLKPLFSSILSAIYDPKAIGGLQLKIANISSQTQLCKNKPYNYYILFERLINQSHQKLLEQNQFKDKQKTSTFLKRFKQTIPLYKIQSYFRKQVQSLENIFGQIQAFFKFYFESDTKKVDENLVSQIFFICAERLFENGMPDMALEIYKSRRFNRKIDQCVQMLIRINRNNNDIIATICLQTARYYQENGLLQKAIQYVDYAYEKSLSNEHLKIKIEMQANLMCNRVPESALTKVGEKIIQSPQKPDESTKKSELKKADVKKVDGSIKKIEEAGPEKQRQQENEKFNCYYTHNFSEYFKNKISKIRQQYSKYNIDVNVQAYGHELKQSLSFIFQ